MVADVWGDTIERVREAAEGHLGSVWRHQRYGRAGTSASGDRHLMRRSIASSERRVMLKKGSKD